VQKTETGFEATDKVVRRLARWLGLVQAAVNTVFYRPLMKLFEPSRQRPWLYFNYIYVFGFWTPLVLGVALVSLWRHGGWWCWLLIIPAWRWLEILVWWAKLLIDRTHTNILAAERNLLFLVADATAVVTGSFAIWRMTESVRPSPSWADALATFTLNGAPPGDHGLLGDVISVASAASGLVVVGAGLALLIGIVGHRVREVPGQYTGPQIPPRD